MVGFPKNLNSKKDYENIIKDFGYTEKVKKTYQALLDTNKHYVFDKELANADDADGVKPEYRVMEEEENGTTKIVQYKLIDNPSSKLKRLGFTIEEVQEVIEHA